MITEEIRAEKEFKKVKTIDRNIVLQLLIFFISEIAELRSTVSELIREVKELRDGKEAFRQENQTGARHFSSPDPSPSRYTKARKNLEPMDHAYKKNFQVSNSYIYF
jgi:hypothetical protein